MLHGDLSDGASYDKQAGQGKNSSGFEHNLIIIHTTNVNLFLFRF